MDPMVDCYTRQRNYSPHQTRRDNGRRTRLTFCGIDFEPPEALRPYSSICEKYVQAMEPILERLSLQDAITLLRTEGWG